MVEQFFAREDEQDRFISVLRRALDEGDGPDEGFLVVVQGHGGIGKTELLNRFGDIVRGRVQRPGISNRFYLVAVDWSTERQNRPADYSSWAGPPIWVALDALYVNLRDEVTGWRARRRFERAFAEYRTQAAKIKAAQPPEAEQSLLPDIVGTAIGVIGGLAPVPGVAAASGGTAKLVTNVAQSIQRARGQVDDRNYDAWIGPDNALVRAFASGVREVSRRRPLVLILDTAEVLGQARHRMYQAVKRSGAKTVWVWGIRLEDEASAAEDSETMLLRRYVDNARLRLVPLSRFDDQTIARYLHARLPRILVTAELKHDVVALTRGIPLAVHLATNLLSSGVPPATALREVSVTGEVSEVISGLAKRYLVHLTQTHDPVMRADLPLIYGLALIDGPTSDPDLLAALWDVPAAEVAKRLDGLALRHDFVLSRQRRMHQDIRRTIRLFLLDPVRRPEVRAANERAVKALRERMNSLSRVTTVEAQMADEEWCAAAAQLLWHTFWVNIRDGVRLLAELIPAAHTLAPSLAVDLLRTADWFEPVVNAEQRALLAGIRVLLPSGSLLNRLQTEFRRAAERLNTPPVVSSAMDFVTDTAETGSSILAPDVPPVVFALILRLRGPVDKEDERAVAVLEQIIELLPVTGVQRLRQIVASRTEALARDVVGKPVTKDIAVSFIRAVVRFAPGNPALQVLLARACEAVGNLNAALAAFEEACRLQPDNADQHIRRGLILRDLRRNEEALAAYEESCRLQPENADWHTNRGVALGRLNRYDEALSAFEEACRLQPDKPDWLSNLGVALGQLNRHEEALPAFEEACRLQPDKPDWHTNRGIALRRLNRYEQALSAFEEACRLQPDNADWHTNRGIALGQLNRHEEALAAFEESCRLQPDTAHQHIRRGLVLRDLHRDEEALAAFDEACRLQPDNADWHTNRGIVLGQLNRHEEALAAFEESCRLQPDKPYWHTNRGIALRRLNRHEEALAAYEESCRLQPDNADWHTNRGIALGRLNRHDEALAAFEEACRLQPENAGWHSNRGIALGRLNRHDEALDACDEGLRLAPDTQHLLNNRGESLMMLRRDLEAVQAFRRSIRVGGGDNLESTVMLALLLHSSEVGKAKELCRLALDMPGSGFTECRRHEMYGLANMILGDPEKAERELRTALAEWTHVDVHQPRLYELLSVGGLAAGADQLLQIWREHWAATPNSGEEAS